MKYLTIFLFLSNSLFACVLQDIIQHESRGNPKAIDRSGLAVGVLQLHPISVAETNRILKREKYTLNDRYDKSKSIEMYNVIITYHETRLGRKLSYKEICYLWNGGPEGLKLIGNPTLNSAKAKNLEIYYQKVKNHV